MKKFSRLLHTRLKIRKSSLSVITTLALLAYIFIVAHIKKPTHAREREIKEKSTKCRVLRSLPPRLLSRRRFAFRARPRFLLQRRIGKEESASCACARRRRRRLEKKTTTRAQRRRERARKKSSFSLESPGKTGKCGRFYPNRRSAKTSSPCSRCLWSSRFQRKTRKSCAARWRRKSFNGSW